MTRRSRTRFRPLHGILLLDKPAGLSSSQALQRVRHLFRAEKGGHTGTLDPLATGLLILGVGAATRLLGLVGGHDKTYEATIRLGQTTVTDDREGEVLTTTSAAGVHDDAVRAAGGVVPGADPGLLNLARNLGQISGASVMGAVFAFASATNDITTALPEAVATGMRITRAAQSSSRRPSVPA